MVKQFNKEEQNNGDKTQHRVQTLSTPNQPQKEAQSDNHSRSLEQKPTIHSQRSDDNVEQMIPKMPIIVLNSSRRAFLLKIALDLLVITTLLLLIFYYFFFGKPYKRGFNCDDDSIRYPYRDNTIPSNILILYSLSIPFIVFCINELFILKSNTNCNSKFLLRTYIWQIYLQIIPFLFAVLSSQLITDISKYSIGRLRPHFLDVCEPIVGNITFTRLTKCPTPEAYLTDFQCSKNRFVGYRQRDSRLSFMSGHSSLSAVSLVYLVIYIQMRVSRKYLGLIKPLFQYLLMCLVLFTGFTRISDYKHHWSDVLTGIIQGTFVAIICAFFVSDLYKQRSYYGMIARKRASNDETIPTNHESNV